MIVSHKYQNVTCHLVNHISISRLIWYLSVQNQISDVVHSISDPLKKYYHILPYVVWYSYHALYRISPIMWCHILSCIITLSLNICLAPSVFASCWCLQDYKMLSSGSCCILYQPCWHTWQSLFALSRWQYWRKPEFPQGVKRLCLDS
jgi:hypothetical protein